MEYILKANAILILFYLCYYFFLQKETFFNGNRAFLIGGLLSSLIIPFIVIPVYKSIPVLLEGNVPEIGALNLEPLASPVETFSWLTYLSYGYVLGVLFFGTRFLFRLGVLLFKLIKCEWYKEEQFLIIETTEDLSPFSFFNWIIFNPTQFPKNEIQQIIAHEKVHASQYHSIDVLLMQLYKALFWFNPFVWLYDKALQQNLEFIADSIAEKEANTTKEYQFTLLKAGTDKYQLALTNNFYNSLLKKRVIMLQTSKSNSKNQVKYSLIIPVLAIFIFMFNVKVIAQEQSGSKDKFELRNINGIENPLIVIDNVIADQSIREINKNEIAGLNVIKGEEAIEKYGEKAKNGVVQITTKKTIVIFKDVKNEKSIDVFLTNKKTILRSGPKDVFTITAEIEKDEQVALMDTSYGEWWAVQYKTKMGFIKKKDVITLAERDAKK